MITSRTFTAIAYLIILFIPLTGFSQNDNDTFFLAKKKGLLGRIGRSISRDGSAIVPVKNENPYLRFTGKKIASVEIVSLGLDRNINDTARVKNNFVVRLANKFHKNSKEKYIRNDLFFNVGDIVIPLMISDNEIYLRDQQYLQDARIILFDNAEDSSTVDVVVITRDVFSLGGRFSTSPFDYVKAEIKEENLAGTGSKLSVSGLYDKARSPKSGVGAEFIKRNVKGSFVNFTLAYNTFNNSFSSLRKEATRIYSAVSLPFVSRFSRWTGMLEWEFNESHNYYNQKLFDSNYRYRYLRSDLWAGYNMGARRKWLDNNMNRLRHFIAVRSFYTQFYQKPEIYQETFHYNFSDINGTLLGYNVYRQNFYRTSFIYGFGRNEDVPVGVSAGVTLGWTNKDGKKRNYYGLSTDLNRYTSKGKFYSFNIRAGTFSFFNRLEDVDLLVSIDHFTALKQLGTQWRNRNFFNVAVTKQFNHLLSPPLFLESAFGLPYYKNGNVEGNFRTAVKGESVFFNMQKIIGFRIAPFVFAGSSFITPVRKSFTKTLGYNAIGGGFRTRNENLIFGTIEVKGYYFTRKSFEEMKTWRFEFSTNLKFRYNSSFIRKPDFVNANQ
ncbi:MAG: hypothetical protein ABIP80_05200 [Ferruginibacter sp.]